LEELAEFGSETLSKRVIF